MNKMAELVAALQDADARKRSVRSQMTEYLMPILRAATGRELDHNPEVQSVSLPSAEYQTYGINVLYRPQRHEPWSDDYYTLPRSVMESADPVEAAHALKADNDRKINEASLASKREQLRKLQAELGVDQPAAPALAYGDLTFDEALGYPDRGTEQNQRDYMAGVAARRAGKGKS